MSNANVSEQSGGQFSSLRIAEQQLARIDDASRNGYVLGYVPANPNLDDKYREVSITVDRRDVTLVYRRGYTATADPGEIDSRDVYTRTRLRDAATGNLNQTDIDVHVKAAVGSRPPREVRVDLTIDVSKLELSETAGTWETDLDVLVLCGDAKQNVVGKLDQRMHLRMDRALYERAIAGGVPYSTTIPVNGSPALVKAIVYHFDTDRLGTATASVR